MNFLSLPLACSLFCARLQHVSARRGSFGSNGGREKKVFCRAEWNYYMIRPTKSYGKRQLKYDVKLREAINGPPRNYALCAHPLVRVTLSLEKRSARQLLTRALEGRKIYFNEFPSVARRTPSDAVNQLNFEFLRTANN